MRKALQTINIVEKTLKEKEIDIGRNFRELRNQFNYSQKELEKLTQIQQSRLSRIETIKEPTLKLTEAVAFAQTFNINLSELWKMLTEEERKKPIETQSIPEQNLQLEQVFQTLKQAGILDNEIEAMLINRFKKRASRKGEKKDG